MQHGPTELVLNTGAKMPILGLGTWKAPAEKVEPAVEYALTECGCRHVDCAAIYHNEEAIGRAFNTVLRSGKVKREELFVTSKLWNTAHGRGDVADACKKTLRDLQLDYLDLYLMHWGVAVEPDAIDTPRNMRGEPLDEQGVLRTVKIPVRETWEAMEELVKNGLVRAIGVANFTGAQLIDLLSYAAVTPAMNQIELHPYHQQTRLIEFCRYQNIAVTAYSPLGSPGNVRGKQNQPILLEDTAIGRIAKQHGKSPAQILIRWALERDTVVIPKSVTPKNIIQNMAVFDFELSKEDMDLIAGLERGHRFVDPWDWWKVPYFE